MKIYLHVTAYIYKDIILYNESCFFKIKQTDWDNINEQAQHFCGENRLIGFQTLLPFGSQTPLYICNKKDITNVRNKK